MSLAARYERDAKRPRAFISGRGKSISITGNHSTGGTAIRTLTETRPWPMLGKRRNRPKGLRDVEVVRTFIGLSPCQTGAGFFSRPVRQALETDQLGYPAGSWSYRRLSSLQHGLI